MAKEKRFEEKVKNFLESNGIYPLGTPKQKIKVKPIGYWEKRWGGSVYVKRGLPDLHIVVNGINLDVELKAEDGEPSDLQEFMIKQMVEAGGIAFVLYPKDFEDFKQLIYKLKEGGDKNDIFP